MRRHFCIFRIGLTIPKIILLSRIERQLRGACCAAGERQAAILLDVMTYSMSTVKTRAEVAGPRQLHLRRC